MIIFGFHMFLIVCGTDELRGPDCWFSQPIGAQIQPEEPHPEQSSVCVCVLGSSRVCSCSEAGRRVDLHHLIPGAVHHLQNQTPAVTDSCATPRPNTETFRNHHVLDWEHRHTLTLD
ncbi:hypothetical protein CHARACLAT_016489 [Characodon lateralis]|uniref:Secreted protein n=1 Tax=Characodon lateralis TaxID=208331 RepID=A0ABU7EK83_9TELE|nr:hypothetical protein [Characodon lateralis]